MRIRFPFVVVALIVLSGWQFIASNGFASAASLPAQVARLNGTDTSGSDSFGCAVGLYEEYVVVGASTHTIGAATATGTAYVFFQHQLGMNAWGQNAKLVAPSPRAGDNFGVSLQMNDQLIAIGAPGREINLMASAGAVFVYSVSHGAWSLLGTLTGSGVAAARFGSSVAVSGACVLAGEPVAAAAYVHCWDGAAWVRDAAWLVGGLSRFGWSVALSDRLAAVGAAFTSGQGFVRVFRRTGAVRCRPPCVPFVRAATDAGRRRAPGCGAAARTCSPASRSTFSAPRSPSALRGTRWRSVRSTDRPRTCTVSTAPTCTPLRRWHRPLRRRVRLPSRPACAHRVCVCACAWAAGDGLLWLCGGVPRPRGGGRRAGPRRGRRHRRGRRVWLLEQRQHVDAGALARLGCGTYGSRSVQAMNTTAVDAAAATRAGTSLAANLHMVAVGANSAAYVFGGAASISRSHCQRGALTACVRQPCVLRDMRGRPTAAHARYVRPAPTRRRSTRQPASRVRPTRRPRLRARPPPVPASVRQR
jgi:hypothetical protein